jgi:hypothetical protein
MEAWCERWNIKINEENTQGIYFSHGRRQSVSRITLNGKNIPFVNTIKHLGVLCDKKNYMEITHTNDRSQGLQNIY